MLVVKEENDLDKMERTRLNGQDRVEREIRILLCS